MLKHRGPDSARWMSACSGWLGACRNAIVGDSTGDQPFVDESGAVGFVGNGEIYNCQAIARELNLGRELRSDIDIVGEVYSRHGSDGFAKFNGEWALAIVDMTRRRLLLSRDSFGTHPLFYFVNQDLVGFASEIKAFTGCAELKLGLNVSGLLECAAAYGPRPGTTCFQNVYEVPPGTCVCIDLDSGSVTPAQHWDEHCQEVCGFGDSTPLSETLGASVSDRLMGTGQPGVLLSGGVDSSIIAALVAAVNRSSTFFSIAFEDPQYDEQEFAETVAQHCGVTWHRFQCDAEFLRQGLVSCVWHVEMPLTRTAPIALLGLSGLIRQHGHKWVLSGEGADELFRGYPVFADGRASVCKRRRMTALIRDLFLPHYGAALNEAEDATRAWRHASARFQQLPEYQRVEIGTKLSRFLLTAQGDRVGLANGVENRYPYLDQRVVRYAVDHGEMAMGKQILRREFTGLLPQRILNRRKMGYLAPFFEVEALLNTDAMPGYLLTAEVTRDCALFREDRVTSLRKHLAGELTEEAQAAVCFVLSCHALHLGFVKKDSGYQQLAESVPGLSDRFH